MRTNYLQAILITFLGFITLKCYAQSTVESIPENRWSSWSVAEGSKNGVYTSYAISTNVCSGMGYAFYRVNSTFNEHIKFKLVFSYADCQGVIREESTFFEFEEAGIQKTLGQHFTGKTFTNVRVIELRFIDREEAAAKQAEEQKKQAEEQKKQAEEQKKQAEEREKQAEEKQKQAEEKQEQAEKQAEEQRKKQAEEQRKKFEESKKAALSRQEEYDKLSSMGSAMGATMTALWAGTYLYGQPVRNRYYNRPGFFISIGPENSFTLTPFFQSENISYHYSKYVTETLEYQKNIHYNFNFGAKLEMGFVSDYMHLLFPIRANYGMFYASWVNYNYSGASKLFLGIPALRWLKIGGSVEYKGNYIDKFNLSTQDGSYSYTVTNRSGEAKYSTLSYKVGLRFLKNFSTLDINTDNAHSIDLFFTMSNFYEQSVNFYNAGNSQRMVYGFEIEWSKYSVFGVFAKVMFMKPVGSIDQPVTGYRPENISVPYIQIGIRREYSFFPRLK